MKTTRYYIVTYSTEKRFFGRNYSNYQFVMADGKFPRSSSIRNFEQRNGNKKYHTLVIHNIMELDEKAYQEFYSID